MSFIHDVVKIKYTREGYVQNYPSHLLSDDEMCDGFLKYPNDPDMDADEKWEAFLSQPQDTAMFNYYYSLPEEFFGRKIPSWANIGLTRPTTIGEAYRELVEAIAYHVEQFKASVDEDRSLPDWVYSYMLGAVIGFKSRIEDIHSYLVMLGCDNLYDEITPESCILAYPISKSWLNNLELKQTLDHRPPTIYGEPHLLKALRIGVLPQPNKGR